MNVKKGDRLVYAPDGKDEVFIEVTRVAKDGSWADIRCFTWAVGWRKRQPLLPMAEIAYAKPRVWNQADLDAQQARWEADREQRAETS